MIWSLLKKEEEEEGGDKWEEEEEEEEKGKKPFVGLGETSDVFVMSLLFIDTCTDPTLSRSFTWRGSSLQMSLSTWLGFQI